MNRDATARLTAFAEWKGLWYVPQVDPVWWEVPIVLGCILLVFGAVALFLLVRERQADPVGWGIVASRGLYAVFRNRAVPYFVLPILPLLALALVRVAPHLPPLAQRESRRRMEALGAVACGVVLIASIVDQAVFTRRFPLGWGVRSDLFPVQAAAFLERATELTAARVLPIRASHLTSLVALPMLHKDPFDRVLIAQARTEDLGILTSDAAIGEYPVRTIW